MALPNTNASDIITSTLTHRSKSIADNAMSRTALLSYLNERGNVETFSGGRLIEEEMSYGENANRMWYTGADTLAVAASDNFTMAQFDIKQAACAVVINGLEELQNSGPEAQFNLLKKRIQHAEGSMGALISEGVYSDGTGYGGKQLAGLLAMVPVTPSTGTYGGIDRSVAGNAFWRSKATDTNAAPSAATIMGIMNTMWASLQRSATEQTDLIVVDSTVWGAIIAVAQPLQRFTDATKAKLGFRVLDFMGADVIMDSGIGGDATTATAYFLNTKYIHWRPHKDRNMVPLRPDRASQNQDVTARILAWAGALTCSGAQFQGQILFS